MHTVSFLYHCSLCCFSGRMLSSLCWHEVRFSLMPSLSEPDALRQFIKCKQIYQPAARLRLCTVWKRWLQLTSTHDRRLAVNMCASALRSIQQPCFREMSERRRSSGRDTDGQNHPKENRQCCSLNYGLRLWYKAEKQSGGLNMEPRLLLFFLPCFFSHLCNSKINVNKINPLSQLRLSVC